MQGSKPRPLIEVLREQWQKELASLSKEEMAYLMGFLQAAEIYRHDMRTAQLMSMYYLRRRRELLKRIESHVTES